jgi:hypothetical protein
MIESALKQLVQRHDSLRTQFIITEEGPRQSFSNPASWSLEQKDISAERNQDELLQQYVREIGEKEFDLENDFLFRAAWVELEAQKHVLILVMPHIITDGWSLSVLIKDLMISIAHERNNYPKPSPLPIQFKDYVAWLEKTQTEEKVAAQQKYWSDKFKGDLPILNLKANFERPSFKSNEGKNLLFKFPKATSQKLVELSHQHDATLFMILLALVKAILFKHSGEEDMVVGTPLAGRSQKELENQAGLFINLVGLRDHIDGEMSFQKLLSGVRNTTLEAYDYQDYPAVNLIQDLNLPLDPSRGIGFDALIVHHNNDFMLDSDEKLTAALQGLSITPRMLESATSRFDLSFDFFQHSNELAVSLEYYTAIFNEETARQIGNDLQELANLVLKNLDMPLKQILKLTSSAAFVRANPTV